MAQTILHQSHCPPHPHCFHVLINPWETQPSVLKEPTVLVMCLQFIGAFTSAQTTPCLSVFCEHGTSSNCARHISLTVAYSKGADGHFSMSRANNDISLDSSILLSAVRYVHGRNEIC